MNIEITGHEDETLTPDEMVEILLTDMEAKRTPYDRLMNFISDKFEKICINFAGHIAPWYCLNGNVKQFMLPQLKKFREKHMGYPGIITEEEWDHILDELIWWTTHDEFDDLARHKEAEKLFGQYFHNLWD